MVDLQLLRTSASFSVDDRPRLAFVHHGFRSPLTRHGQDERASFASRYPPLGLLALMRHLEHDLECGTLRAEPAMRYFDEAGYVDDEALAAEVAKWLSLSHYQLLLVGVYTVSLERTLEFLDRFDPTRTCIVAGGPHITTAPGLDAAHIAVRGEGGAAIRHIINDLLRPGFGQGADADGVCFVDEGVTVIKKAAFDRSLAEIPAPAYDYAQSPVPPQPHWAREVGRLQQIYVCTQSCGARCTFCSTYLIHGRFVSRPSNLVKQDLEIMVDRFGYDAIEFHDDDILQHRDIDAVFDSLEELSLMWSCNARTELVDAELAQRMFRAGCRRVFLGVESMDQRTLDYFNKGCTVEDNERAIRVLEEAGIGVIAGFIVGAPHHTLESVLREFDTFLALPIYFLAASILTPDIGTVEYRRARKANPRLQLLESGPRGLSIRPRPDLFGGQVPFGMPTVCDALSKKQLNELYELVQCEFFLRPDARTRILRHTPTRRHELVSRWYASIESTAHRLAATAELEPVKVRLTASLAQWAAHASARQPLIRDEPSSGPKAGTERDEAGARPRRP